MPHKLKYNKTLGIIEPRYDGVLSSEEVRSATSECIELTLKHRVRSTLIDAEDIQTAPPLATVIELPQQYEEEGLTRLMRVAIVAPKVPSEEATAHFYVRFCRNRGWMADKFETRDQAIAWLTRNKSK